MGYIFLNFSKIFVVLFLPFVVLVRGSIYFHYTKGLPTSLSIGIASVLVALLLFWYFAYLYTKLGVRKNNSGYLRRRFAILLMIVSGFVLYGLVFVSPSNTKGDQVRREFYSLHPIMRLACSTLFLIDKKAVITDANRQPEDYRKMGLDTAKNSLHYKQSDGYAYAVDLRTIGRWEIRNTLLIGYFNLMGFNTLRHIGTADHLHISMPCRYNKRSR